MRCFSHQPQILDGVVVPILVGVVNDLGGIEVTPKVTLHDEAMLHDVSLAVGVRMGGNEDRPVVSAASVGDAFAEAGVVDAPDVAPLPCGLTGHRTEPLASLASAGGWVSALDAGWDGRIAPSIQEVAGTRTEPLIASIFGEEVGRTSGALASGFAFHTPLYHIEERYCEIAAKRMAQGVLL